MVNRAALILRWKDPGIAWINEADPVPDAIVISRDMVNEERTVYLLSDADAESDTAVRRWVKRNYKELFEAELEGWYTDEALWPSSRTLRLFDAWFDVECHSVLIDTVGGPIIDDP